SLQYTSDNNTDGSSTDITTLSPSFALFAKIHLVEEWQQATSVPSEQIFSKAGDTIRAKRVRFSEKSVQTLMCTGSWLEHGIRFQRD
ncbi:18279_t:CDS:2, partial [Racocetra persica]